MFSKKEHFQLVSFSRTLYNDLEELEKIFVFFFHFLLHGMGNIFKQFDERIRSYLFDFVR